MTIESMTGSRPWLTAGWTMLHFLWAGGALGLAAAAGRLALRRAAPEVRYGFALLCLGTMAVAPAAIAVWLSGMPEHRAAPAVRRAADASPLPRPPEAMPASGAMALPPGLAAIPPEMPDPTRAIPAPEGWLEAAAAGLPWLWIAGAPATFAMLAAGLVGAERIRRGSRPVLDAELNRMARGLADALGIVRPVALGVCDRLASPILLGVVRPLILLPAAAVAGWGPDQLEMALLHELAHVRRYDNLVNLAQRLIESLLFFHPAVWWVSGWVRREREHCCDRMVVARTGRARPYAALLAELALHGSRPGRTAVAMAESPIVSRIRCILSPEEHLMPLSRPVIALAAALVVAPAVLIAASRAGAPGPEARPERAQIEDLIRRTRHGAEMFLGVQDRVYALIQIAGVQARTGDKEAALRTFQQAEQLAETVSFDDATYSPHILFWIIQAERRHGFRDQAISTSRKLLRLAETPARRETQKLNLYPNLIKELMDLGDKDGVQEALRAGRTYYTTKLDPGFEAYAPGNIAGLQAASGDLAGALRLVRDPAFIKGSTRPGPPGAAPAAIKPTPDENAANLRHGALFQVVAAIHANNREGADAVLQEALRDVADRKEPHRWNVMAIKNQDLQAIAYAQSGLGRFDEAVNTARMIDAETSPEHMIETGKPDFLDQQRFRKTQTLAEIARAQAKAGDKAGARRTAEEAARVGRMNQNDSQKYQVVETAQVLAMSGDAAEALRLADTLGPDLRTTAYDAIAAIQRDAGDAAGARKTTQAAMDFIRSRLEGVNVGILDRGTSEGKQGHALLESFGRYQARLGDRKAAIETIRRINDGGRQIEALQHLATDLASAGDLDGALEAVGAINSPKSEAEALEWVAAALSRRPAAP